MADAYQMTNGKNIDEPGSGFDPFDPYKNRDPRMLYSMYVPGSILPDGQVMYWTCSLLFRYYLMA